MNRPYKIEICANSVASCIAAQQGGAHRVELCAGIPEGGTTPSYGMIQQARQNINIKLHVIIRPRGGDFLYNTIEQQIMQQDIAVARQLGADGVVFGCLTPDGQIDTQANQQLIDAASGLSVTFHRAFDMCSDPHQALEQLIALRFDRVLTSGQEATAPQGIPLLKKLVQQADNRIIILPGCGVNEANIAQIAAETGACEFHMSARSKQESNMTYRNNRVSMGGTVVIDEYRQEVTDPHKVRNLIHQLTQ